MRCVAYILFVILIGSNHVVSAQIEPIDDSLRSFVNRRYDISLRGNNALMAWSIANIGTGIFGSVSSDGRAHYFHQMNGFWGGINLIISAAGYASLRRTKYQPLILHRSELNQKKTERAFLINMGLDVVYMGGGAALLEYSKDEFNPDRMEGYGYSLMFQGAFLLSFDSILYLLHRSNRKHRLDPLLYKLSFTGNCLIYRFG